MSIYKSIYISRGEVGDLLEVLPPASLVTGLECVARHSELQSTFAHDLLSLPNVASSCVGCTASVVGHVGWSFCEDVQSLVLRKWAERFLALWCPPPLPDSRTLPPLAFGGCCPLFGLGQSLGELSPATTHAKDDESLLPYIGIEAGWATSRLRVASQVPMARAAPCSLTSSAGFSRRQSDSPVGRSLSFDSHQVWVTSLRELGARERSLSRARARTVGGTKP